MITLFEDLIREEVEKLDAIIINDNVKRVPSFGWGDRSDLVAYLNYYEEKHNPLIWSVPQSTQDTGIPGLHQRGVELNLCVVESNTDYLNEIRLQPDRSFKKVLIPMWQALERRIQISNMDMVEEQPLMELFPNYKLEGEHASKYIWDVMKLTFTVQYSTGLVPI